MKKLFCLFLTIIMIMGSVCGCGMQSGKNDEGGKGDSVPVVLNEVAHSIFYAPMYVAIEEGYFAEEGIDLTLITGFGADKTMTALLTGEADIGFMGSESTIYTYKEGASDPAVNFAQLTQRAGNFLVSREPVDNFSWDMLIGKNVLGGRAGGMPEMVFEFVLKKNNIDPFASITQEVDSIRYQADSIPEDKLPEEPQPIQADESFDDFIYNFASDEVLQRQRVKFPLPYYNGEKKMEIDEHHWMHDNLFTKQHYYTLLFDKEEDMDLVGDTSLTSVQVEWIFVKTRMMKRYYFERIKGAWILEAINQRPIEPNDNENFVEFFGRFATDSLFQSQRVNDPLAFVTSDPDDDFSILETSLDLNQWFAFKPELPSERLSNINYGQRNDDNSTMKIEGHRQWFFQHPLFPPESRRMETV